MKSPLRFVMIGAFGTLTLACSSETKDATETVGAATAGRTISAGLVRYEQVGDAGDLAKKFPEVADLIKAQCPQASAVGPGVHSDANCRMVEIDKWQERFYLLTTLFESADTATFDGSPLYEGDAVDVDLQSDDLLDTQYLAEHVAYMYRTARVRVVRPNRRIQCVSPIAPMMNTGSPDEPRVVFYFEYANTEGVVGQDTNAAYFLRVELVSADGSSSTVFGTGYLRELESKGSGFVNHGGTDVEPDGYILPTYYIERLREAYDRAGLDYFDQAAKSHATKANIPPYHTGDSEVLFDIVSDLPPTGLPEEPRLKRLDFASAMGYVTSHSVDVNAKLNWRYGLYAAPASAPALTDSISFHCWRWK